MKDTTQVHHYDTRELARKFNACPVPNNLGQRIRRKFGWIGRCGDGVVWHVAYPVLG